MKRMWLLGAAAAGLAMIATPAFADEPGWYLRGNVGYGAHTDTEFDMSILRGDIQSEGNVAGSLGVGYDFGNHWRMELDADSLWTDMGQIGNQPGSFSKLRTNTLMLNAIFDFNNFGRIEPYVGAGVGMMHGTLKAEAHDYLNPVNSVANIACLGGVSGICSVDGTDVAFGWQLLAGLGYKLTDNLVWDTHYTFQKAFSDMKFPGEYRAVAGGAPVILHPTELKKPGSHTVMTGLRYKFGPKQATFAPVAALPSSYTCWDGSVTSSFATCPSKPPAPATSFQCWDDSVVSDRADCPTPPVVSAVPATTTTMTYVCWDNSMVSDAAYCPDYPTPATTTTTTVPTYNYVQPSSSYTTSSIYGSTSYSGTTSTYSTASTSYTGAYNDCGPSSIAIFNVPVGEEPKKMNRLGTMPQFGDSHDLTPSEFFQKLKDRYDTNSVDKTYLNYLFRSIGYTNGFADAQDWMFSEETLPVGTKGMLGFGEYHHFAYSVLPTQQRDREAFRIQGLNGEVVHFMKTCGNYMYACN